MFASDTVDRSRKGRFVAAVLGAAVGLSAILSTTAPAFADDGDFMKPANKWSLGITSDATARSVQFDIVRKDDPSIVVFDRCAPVKAGGEGVLHDYVLVPPDAFTLDSRFQYEGKYTAFGSRGCTGEQGPTKSVEDFDPLTEQRQLYKISVSLLPDPTPTPIPS